MGFEYCYISQLLKDASHDQTPDYIQLDEKVVFNSIASLVFAGDKF